MKLQPPMLGRWKKKQSVHAQDQIKQRWEENQMHGQYPKRIGEKDLDHEMTNKGSKQLGWNPKRRVLSSLPKTRPSKPTTTGTKSSKMAQTQCVGYVVYSRKPLTILWQDVLSWPKLNIYIGITRLPHTCIGTSVNNSTLTQNQNGTNMSPRQCLKKMTSQSCGTCQYRQIVFVFLRSITRPKSAMKYTTCTFSSGHLYSPITPQYSTLRNDIQQSWDKSQ